MIARFVPILIELLGGLVNGADFDGADATEYDLDKKDSLGSTDGSCGLFD